MAEPLLALTDFRDVGTYPAEAFETASGIDNRVACDRYPAVPTGGLELHFERIERCPVEEAPSEFGMAAKQGWEGMTDELARGTPKQGDHSRGNVGYAILAVD